MIFTLHNGNSYVVGPLDRVLFDVSAFFGEDSLNPIVFLFAVVVVFFVFLLFFYDEG